MANQSLETSVKSYWTNREKSSAKGLALLDQCIERFAAHGDWDHLSRFVVSALKTNQAAHVKRVIRIAFGDHVKFGLDSKHPTGGKFTKVNWPGNAFPLNESNSYSIVKAAIAAGEGWDSKAFQAKLSEALPAKVKPARTVDTALQTKTATALAKRLADLRDEGFDLGALVREAQAILAAKAEPAH